MDLSDYRKQIDEIDDQLVKLFEERMEVTKGVVEYKKEHGMKILDAGREREKLATVCAKVKPELQNYTSVLYSSIFELSRSYQSRHMTKFTDLSQKISDAIENTPRLFPENAAVAVSGVEGAYAQIATEKMFKRPFIMYMNNFQGVFSAIDSSLSQ